MLVKFFKKFTSLKREREELLAKAKQEAQTITFKAQEDARKIAADALEVEKRLAHREDQIEEKDNLINRERQSVQDLKNNIEAITLESEIFVHQEKFETAKKRVDDALRLEPTNIKALEVLADAHEGLAQWDIVENLANQLMLHYEKGKEKYWYYSAGNGKWRDL